MAGRLRTYAFINAKLRARISLILPAAFYDQLMRAPDLGTALSLVRETSFAAAVSAYERTGDMRMAELDLFTREIALHLDLERYLTGEPLAFAEAMAMRYEVEVLKAGLRVWFDRVVHGRDSSVSGGYLFRGRVHHDIEIDRLLAAGGIDEVVEALRGTPYAGLVAEHSAAIQGGSLFEAEIALDRAFFQQLLAAAAALEPVDREIAERMIAVEIDLLNAAWMVRFRVAYDLPLESAMSFLIPSRSGLSREEVAAAYLQQIMRHEVGRLLSGYPFTIGTVLAYVVLKRNEIRTLMTILNAKLYGLSQERIRGVL